MIDVSVVTPAWNAYHTIIHAVKSALSQSAVSVEVIVADDASTDATGEAVRALNDERVTCLRLPVNGGPAAARNAAISASRGTWIAVLDADDVFLPGRLSKLVAAASTNGFDIIADNMMVEDAGGARRLFIDEELDGSVHPVSLSSYVMSNRLFGDEPGLGYLKPLFSADFLRRSSLRYDPAARVGEDFLLVAEAMTLGAHYGRVRSAGYVYTTRAGTISHRLTRRDADAMVDADRRYLAHYGAQLDPAEHTAWSAHLRSLEDGAGFVAMIDSIKSRDLPGLARLVWRRPAAVRHFSMPIRAKIERLTRRQTPQQMDAA